MEAARPLAQRPSGRADAIAAELEDLRPLGEAFLLRRFSGISRADAEDAVAEVIIRLHRRIAAGRGPDKLRAVFFTSVRNAAIDHFRSRQARPTAPLELVAERPSEEPAPLERAESREDAARLQDALGRMRPNYREAILLRFGAGLTVPEIGERLGISLPAAKKLVLRSTEQARRRLAALEDHDFCPEMRDGARRAVLDREAAGLATEAERRLLQAHFRHCGSCRTFLADLHRHLHDLGGSALIAVAAGERGGVGLGIADHFGRWLGNATHAVHAGAGRLRLSAYKLGGAFNGADAGSAGALGASAQKAIALCGAATAATATCVATGLVGPGLGVSASSHDPPQHDPAPAAIVSHPSNPVPEEVPPSPPPETEPQPVQAPQAPTEPPPAPAADVPPSEPAPAPEPAAEQFGFESSAAGTESAPPPEPPPPPSPAPSSDSGGAGGEGGRESFGFSG